jgi:hypothetical protein
MVDQFASLDFFIDTNLVFHGTPPDAVVRCNPFRAERLAVDSNLINHSIVT